MAKPGDKPKPKALRVLQGNPSKRPLPQTLDVEPSLPSAPEHLSAEARAEWDRVATELYLIGCLSKIDRAALAAYCQAYGRWVVAEQKLSEMAERDPITAGLMIKTSNGNVVQNPLVGAANRAMREMVRIAVEFGMTPSSRMNMPAKVEKTDGKWHGLLAS